MLKLKEDTINYKNQCRVVVIESAKILSKAALLEKLLHTTLTQLSAHIAYCSNTTKQVV